MTWKQYTAEKKAEEDREAAEFELRMKAHRENIAVLKTKIRPASEHDRRARMQAAPKEKRDRSQSRYR